MGRGKSALLAFFAVNEPGELLRKFFLGGVGSIRWAGHALFHLSISSRGTKVSILSILITSDIGNADEILVELVGAEFLFVEPNRPPFGFTKFFAVASCE